MSSIFHIIEDEYERLIEAKIAYELAIQKEEQGSPQIKRKGLKDYLYLAKRNGNKVKYKYIGQINNSKANNVLESIKQRKKYQELLSNIKNDIKEVKKVLRGKI